MKSSAGNARGKWPCRGRGHRPAVMVTAAAVLFTLCGPGGAAKVVPLPKPRPLEAPAAKAEPPPGEQETPSSVDKPAAEPAAPSPQLSACRTALTEEIAIAPSIPDIRGPGGCGGADLVRLEAVVLPDRHRVAVKPAAILRCTMASAIADWIRTDMTAFARRLGSAITDLDNFNSFECRSRNRIIGAQLSEHGRANALDVRSLKLADGRLISFTDRTVPQRAARGRPAFGMCAVFDRARARFGLVPRGSRSSRPDGSPQRLPDLPVECVGPVAAGRAEIAGRTSAGRSAARGRGGNRRRAAGVR